MKSSEMCGLSRFCRGGLSKVVGLSLIASLFVSACAQRSIPSTVGDLSDGITGRLGIGQNGPIPDANGIVTRGNVRYIIATRGDTLAAMAGRAGVSPSALASHNGLPASYQPRSGEALAIPNIVKPVTPIGFGKPQDPTIDSTSLGIDGAAQQISSHKVIAGETIFEVARLYNVSVADVARANNLSGNLAITPGQILVIPAQQLASLDTPASPISSTPTASDGQQDGGTIETSTPQTNATPATNRPFKAPVSGSIQQGYDPGNDADGYVYSTSTQAPVESVGGGKVVLVNESTGDQGTVVMVQHPNGLISIYGRMSNLKVSKGDQVSKGQIIGTTESEQLMFQIRRGTSPVDPADYI